MVHVPESLEYSNFTYDKKELPLYCDKNRIQIRSYRLNPHY